MQLVHCNLLKVSKLRGKLKVGRQTAIEPEKV